MFGKEYELGRDFMRSHPELHEQGARNMADEEQNWDEEYYPNVAEEVYNFEGVVVINLNGHPITKAQVHQIEEKINREVMMLWEHRSVTFTNEIKREVKEMVAVYAEELDRMGFPAAGDDNLEALDPMDQIIVNFPSVPHAAIIAMNEFRLHGFNPWILRIGPKKGPITELVVQDIFYIDW